MPDKILMKPTNEHIFVSIRAHLDKFPQGTHCCLARHTLAPQGKLRLYSSPFTPRQKIIKGTVRKIFYHNFTTSNKKFWKMQILKIIMILLNFTEARPSFKSAMKKHQKTVVEPIVKTGFTAFDQCLIKGYDIFECIDILTPRRPKRKNLRRCFWKTC